MRVTLGINAAGDMRLRVLQDPRGSPRTVGGDPALLVCSSMLQVPDNKVQKSGKRGFGVLSQRSRFTRYASTFMREVGAVFDRRRKRATVFLTGTLPGSTESALSALAAYSGWVVQAITQWLRDRYAGSRVFGVWEYQKRGALHIHLCVQCTTELGAVRLRHRWKDKWLALLDSVGEKSGVDLYERVDGSTWAQSRWICRTDAQLVEKSVGAYLGKYLGKGQCKVRNRCSSPPSAWWFADRCSRQEVKQSRKVHTVEALHLSTAIDLFERIGAVLAEAVPNSFAYICPYNCQMKGLISLASPVHASMLWDSLCEVLAVLGDRARAAPRQPLNTVDACMVIFSAVKIDCTAPQV